MILYYKGFENGKIDTLSQQADYFEGKKKVKYLILKIN